MKHRFRAPIAVHLCLLRDDEVLLLRRRNTGFGDGQYSVVAGCCDGGESVTTAMIREAREEAGIDLSADDLRVATVLHRRAGSDWEGVDFFFLARRFHGEVVNREPEKCDHLDFFRLANLPDALIPYVRVGLTNALSGVPFAEFGWG